MRYWIWGSAAVVLLLGTAAVAVLSALAGWTAELAAAAAPTTWGLPGWLAAWLPAPVALALAEWAQATAVGLNHAVPWLQPAARWLSSALWVGWALLAALVVAMAALAHRLGASWMRPGTAYPVGRAPAEGRALWNR